MQILPSDEIFDIQPVGSKGLDSALDSSQVLLLWEQLMLISGFLHANEFAAAKISSQ